MPSKAENAQRFSLGGQNKKEDYISVSDDSKTPSDLSISSSFTSSGKVLEDEPRKGSFQSVMHLQNKRDYYQHQFKNESSSASDTKNSPILRVTSDRELKGLSLKTKESIKEVRNKSCLSRPKGKPEGNPVSGVKDSSSLFTITDKASEEVSQTSSESIQNLQAKRESMGTDYVTEGSQVDGAYAKKKIREPIYTLLTRSKFLGSFLNQDNDPKEYVTKGSGLEGKQSNDIGGSKLHVSDDHEIESQKCTKDKIGTITGNLECENSAKNNTDNIPGSIGDHCFNIGDVVLNTKDNSQIRQQNKVFEALEIKRAAKLETNHEQLLKRFESVSQKYLKAKKALRTQALTLRDCQKDLSFKEKELAISESDKRDCLREVELISEDNSRAKQLAKKFFKMYNLMKEKYEKLMRSEKERTKCSEQEILKLRKEKERITNELELEKQKCNELYQQAARLGERLEETQTTIQEYFVNKPPKSTNIRTLLSRIRLPRFRRNQRSKVNEYTWINLLQDMEDKNQRIFEDLNETLKKRSVLPVHGKAIDWQTDEMNLEIEKRAKELSLLKQAVEDCKIELQRERNLRDEMQREVELGKKEMNLLREENNVLRTGNDVNEDSLFREFLFAVEKIKGLVKDNSELQHQNKALENNVSKLQEQAERSKERDIKTEQYLEELSFLNNTVAALKNELKAVRCRGNMLQEENTNLTENIAKLVKMEAKHDSELKKMNIMEREHLAATNEQLRRERERVDDLIKHIANIENDNRVLGNQVRELKKQLEIENDERCRLNTENFKLEERANELLKHIIVLEHDEIKTQGYLKDFSASHHTIDNLKNELQSVKSRNAYELYLAKDISELNGTVDNLRNELQSVKCQKTSEQYLEDISKLNDTVASLMNELKSVKCENTKLWENCNHLRKENNQIVTELNWKHDEQLESLNATHKEKEAAKDRQPQHERECVDALKRQILKLQKELKSATRKISDLHKNEITNIKDEPNALQSKISVMEKEFDELSDIHKREMKDLKEGLSVSQTEKSALKKEVNELQKQIILLQSNDNYIRENTNKQINEPVLKFERYLEEISVLNDTVEIIKNELKALRCRNSEIREENNRLKENIKTLVEREEQLREPQNAQNEKNKVFNSQPTPEKENVGMKCMSFEMDMIKLEHELNESKKTISSLTQLIENKDMVTEQLSEKINSLELSVKRLKQKKHVTSKETMMKVSVDNLPKMTDEGENITTTLHCEIKKPIDKLENQENKKTGFKKKLKRMKKLGSEDTSTEQDYAFGKVLAKPKLCVVSEKAIDENRSSVRCQTHLKDKGVKEKLTGKNGINISKDAILEDGGAPYEDLEGLSESKNELTIEKVSRGGSSSEDSDETSKGSLDINFHCSIKEQNDFVNSKEEIFRNVCEDANVQQDSISCKQEFAKQTWDTVDGKLYSDGSSLLDESTSDSLKCSVKDIAYEGTKVQQEHDLSHKNLEKQKHDLVAERMRLETKQQKVMKQTYSTDAEIEYLSQEVLNLEQKLAMVEEDSAEAREISNALENVKKRIGDVFSRKRRLHGIARAISQKLDIIEKKITKTNESIVDKSNVILRDRSELCQHRKVCSDSKTPGTEQKDLFLRIKELETEKLNLLLSARDKSTLGCRESPERNVEKFSENEKLKENGPGLVMWNFCLPKAGCCNKLLQLNSELPVDAGNPDALEANCKRNLSLEKLMLDKIANMDNPWEKLSDFGQIANDVEMPRTEKFAQNKLTITSQKICGKLMNDTELVCEKGHLEALNNSFNRSLDRFSEAELKSDDLKTRFRRLLKEEGNHGENSKTEIFSGELNRRDILESRNSYRMDVEKLFHKNVGLEKKCDFHESNDTYNELHELRMRNEVLIADTKIFVRRERRKLRSDKSFKKGIENLNEKNRRLEERLNLVMKHDTELKNMCGKFEDLNTHLLHGHSVRNSWRLNTRSII